MNASSPSVSAASRRRIVEVPAVARITKKAPAKQFDPNDPNAPRPPVGSKMLGGTYRVIHGRIAIPRPEEDLRLPDGSENVHLSKTIFAEMGDEVLLSHIDAELMLDADVVEPLDARPSRVGKVWAPPPTKQNLNGLR
jgi:hypothetical protein